MRYSDVSTTPDGALWVHNDLNLAHISPTGGLVGAWRVDAGFDPRWMDVRRNGIESEVELRAYGGGSYAWGPVLAPGTLPATVKRLQGFPGEEAHVYVTRASDNAPWLAVSYRYEPDGSGLARLTSAGEIGWTVGFDMSFNARLRDDGSIVMWDFDSTADELNVALVSSSGGIVYQRALSGFTTYSYPYEWQDSILLMDDGYSGPGGEDPVRFAEVNLSSGQVAASWQVTPPDGWNWGNRPSVRTDPTGVLLCSVIRPNPPMTDFDSNAGASLIVCKYTTSGTLSWMREFRMGSVGTAPYFSSADLTTGGVATTTVIRWQGYPDAFTYTSSGGTNVDSGEQIRGFTTISTANGFHWSRRDWWPSDSLWPESGGTDLVLCDEEKVSRFSASGTPRWTRSLPLELTSNSLSGLLAYPEEVIGTEWVSDPASSFGESPVYSRHTMGFAGPSGFRLGSLTPLRCLPHFAQISDAPDLVWGWRSTPSGYRPLVARSDSQGRPTDWCMGASMTYGSASTPGTPYSLMTGNAPAPTKTNLNLVTENRNFATSANFTLTTESLTLTPISASLLSPCD